jgi:pilus assembly protein Flp/PilA
MIAFFRDEEGQGLVEYALIIAVIAIAVIVAMVFLRGQIQNIFSNIGARHRAGAAQGGRETGRLT